jgi:hippurate hydrolase
VAAAEAAVVTVGSLQAGTKENIIPDEARSTAASTRLRTPVSNVRTLSLMIVSDFSGASRHNTSQPSKADID